MSFFELFRQNIPIFAPSITLLAQWHNKHKIMSGRIYGNPERYIDLIGNFSSMYVDSFVPDPNDDMNVISNKYWFKFSDIYVFPHIATFGSWYQLYELLATVNLTEISKNMMNFNRQHQQKIKKQWDSVFEKMVPLKRDTTKKSRFEYSNF